MIHLVYLLGTFGTLAILVLFYILAQLSKRFGAVIKMPPLYRYYYWASLPVGIGFVTQLSVAVLNPFFSQQWLITPGVLLLGYYIPLSIGVTMSLVVTWRYWGWLFMERNE